MGKIHDRFKKAAASGHRAGDRVVRRAVPGTAERISNLLKRIDAARNGMATAARHELMYELADEAKSLGLKGRWNLLCNRTQCLRPDATWYNRGSYAFYCADCAHDLNKVNARDAENLLGAGQKLCIEIATASQAENLHVMG